MHLPSDITKIFLRLFLCSALALSAHSLQAQHQQKTIVPVASETLSGAFVRCIIKDYKGYMWFGTGNGLFRFDGTNIYRYEHTPGKHNTIPSNRINTIVEDGEQNLWIGTAQGLVLYDREKDNFLNIDLLESNTNHLTNKYITALVIDRRGLLWIGTHGHGLNIYNPTTFSFTYLTGKTIDNKIPPSNYVTSLLLTNDTLWAATKGGLKLFDTKRSVSIPIPTSDPTLLSKEITQVVRDPEKNMWFSTADRQIIKLSTGAKYEIKKTAVQQNMFGAGDGNILTLCFDQTGNLWIGGENSGLSYLDAKSLKLTQYEAEDDNPKTLPTNSVRFVYADTTGVIWIGTHNKGAFFIDINSKKFETFQDRNYFQKGLSRNNIKGVAEDKYGNIWVASDGGGLGVLNFKSNDLQYDQKINNKMGTRYLSDLLFDENGNLWIGSLGRGVFYLDLKTHEVKNYTLTSGGFGENKVFRLYEDKNKRIWAGSLGSGLFFFDPKRNEFVSINDEIEQHTITQTAFITSIQEDANNKLWIGSLFGLHELKPDDKTSYDITSYYKSDEAHAIGSNEVQTIFLDASSNLWFGTGDNGLAMLRKEATFETLNKKDGLPSNSVKGILQDAKGQLWTSSSMGISKIDIDLKTFRNYTKEDGLPSNEFNANACLQASNGKFYFGSDNGLIAFYPDSVQDNTTAPTVYLTDLKLNNQSVTIGTEGSPLQKHLSLTNSIELQHSQRSFVIDFVAINYGHGTKSQYCYKLEGFDNDWNCTGPDHTATYTNLDPGNYTFFVKASNGDGLSSNVPTQLKITIHQAPWKTWWAILIYIAGLTSITLFLMRIRIDRINIKNQLELEKMAREKEHALSESKTQFFTNISHEFRTPLSLIAMPLESLISTDLPTAVKEKLGTIRSSAEKMTRLVNELMDFNKLESAKLKLRIQHGELIQFITEIAAIFSDLAVRRNIHFRIHPMVRSLEGWFDRDKLEKTLVNLLSNAFKFTSDNGQINVVINSRDSISHDGQPNLRHLELVIIDNGIGIPSDELPFIFDKFYQSTSSAKVANPGTGIGLSLTKGLVELHQGTIEVQSLPDKETKFTILIPISHQVYNIDDVLESDRHILTQSLKNGEIVAPINVDDLDDHDHDKPQILVVEDNDELRNYISLELRQQFCVMEATNGEEALHLAFEKTPDLIISDILMPVKNGIELCREIKSNIKTSHIPFILLTAKTTVEDQITGIASGADLYINKPFSIRFLVAHVNQIIESRQKLYSRFSQDVYLLPNKVASNEIDQAFLQKAINYIISNIQESQLGVDSLATLFNLSRMQLYRKIKALTGKSVVDFIRMVRIKQALKLMESQRYTLSEIAFQTGFNSASYFTRCFKDQYGKAPSEYMESNARA